MLTQVDAGSSYALLLAGYLLFGIALGLVYAPMSTAAMAAMPAEKVGIASGVLAMDRSSPARSRWPRPAPLFHALLRATATRFAAAVAGSTWVLVALCALGAVLTWAFVRDAEPPGPDPAVAGDPRPGSSTTTVITAASTSERGYGFTCLSDLSTRIWPDRIPERNLPS